MSVKYDDAIKLLIEAIDWRRTVAPALPARPVAV